MKPTSCPRVVCSSENSVSLAKERHPRDETFTVQVGNPESSSSYDIRESEDVAKEHPQRAVPDSVTTPGPKLKPQSTNKGRKRGRIFYFESPAKKNILDGKAEDVISDVLPTCLKNATRSSDADSTNFGSIICMNRVSNHLFDRNEYITK